jgi:insulysin
MENILHNRPAATERLAEHLEKPLLDTRTYRVVRLPNQLQALLIHDPETDKAAAAMDVNVGSMADPEEMQGMAHAVEHLLFMGTEKVSVPSQLLVELSRLIKEDTVPWGERLQRLPDQVRRLFQCVHRVYIHQLLL